MAGVVSESLRCDGIGTSRNSQLRRCTTLRPDISAYDLHFVLEIVAHVESPCTKYGCVATSGCTTTSAAILITTTPPTNEAAQPTAAKLVVFPPRRRQRLHNAIY